MDIHIYSLFIYIYKYKWELQDSPVDFEILTHCKTQIINMKRFIGNRLLACPLPSSTCHFSPSRACNSGCCSSATWILATENNHELSRTPNTGIHEWANELTTHKAIWNVYSRLWSILFLSLSLSLCMAQRICPTENTIILREIPSKLFRWGQMRS